MRNPLLDEIVLDNAPSIDRRDWAKSLCAKHRDALGGVHLGILDAHVALGHVVVARAQGQLMGCLVSKAGLASDSRIFPIIAAAVPDDLQRMHVGFAMLDGIVKTHALDASRIIQACCRADLPSNRFWAAAGFTPIAVRTTNSARGKPVILWRRRVDRGHAGCHVYHAPRKPRGGGGRWIPLANPEQAERVSHDATDIINALGRCGMSEWGLTSGHVVIPPQVSMPLVDQQEFWTRERSALTNGR